ncbi:TonB-dependent receptor [candidate division KSB1 bacterium]|nr:TonB-dependent receptor [candidate division KSB1 bacterium]
MEFRDGNTDEFDMQLDMSMAGVGAIMEGPISNHKGSWLMSARRSYLDLVVDAIDTGTAPRYGDIHGKLTYDINPRHRLSFLTLYGRSDIGFSKQEAIDSGQPSFGEFAAQQNTVGMNWRWLWSNKGYSKASLSHSFICSDRDFNNIITSELQIHNDYLEGAVNFRNLNYFQISKTNRVEFGVDGAYNFADYDYYYASDLNRLGQMQPALTVDNSFRSTRIGGYFSYMWYPVNHLMMNWGVRGDYNSINGKYHTSPRLSATWQVSPLLSFNAAIGEFYQTLPTFIISQDAANENLDDTRALHYVVGCDYLLTADTKMSIKL